MSSLVLCRTCLTFSSKMHNLWNTQLQETFEKLTNKRMSERVLVCYICYAMLQRYHRFADMSWKSEMILSELIDKGIKITQAIVTRIGRHPPYSVTPIQYFYNGLKETSEEKNYPAELDYQIVKVEDIEIEESNKITEITLKHKPIAEEIIIKEELEEMWLEEDIDSESIAEEITIKGELEEMWLEQDTEEMWLEDIDAEKEEVGLEEKIDVEEEVTPESESIIKSEDIILEEEYVDIEELDGNFPLLLPSSNQITKECQAEDNPKPKKKHLKAQTKKLTCDICSKTFKTKLAIKRHMTKHTDKTPYTCCLCDKGFRQQRYLKEHIKVHTGEKAFICHICGAAFTDRSSMNRHTKNHAVSNEVIVKKHVCDVCNKRFRRRYVLREHIMTVHTGVRPYKCPVCKHAFSQKCSLVAHMRIHTGEKTHYCSKCNKGFYRKGHLHQHMRVHTSERPFKCVNCAKRYTTKRSLLIHSCVFKKQTRWGFV